jgi:transcriptional regulator with XRE-family HTH domain
VSSSRFSDELKKARREGGLTQQQLATRSGLSVATIQSYEQGRRVPRQQELQQLRLGLDAGGESWSRVRSSLGLEPEPRGLAATLAKFRPPPNSTWDEVQGCEWVSLVINERKEIVAWNQLANEVSELDLGNLPSGLARGVLRMAATEHYAERLMNWRELIGRLISFLKTEGGDISLGPVPAYLQATLDDIGARDPRFLPELFDLWLTAPLWPPASRNIHPIEWRLSTGELLRFYGLFGEWSDYDGLFSFDWHAADGPTAEWVAARRSELGQSRPAPPMRDHTLGEELALARSALKLTRTEVAGRAGVSVAALAAYESGRRRPSRLALLAVGRALTLDGYGLNRMLRIAGHAEEPSDFARWLCGDTAVGVLQGILPAPHASLSALRLECDSLAFPSVILDQGCHAVYGNRFAERLFGLSKQAPLPGRAGPHLLQAMVSPEFRSRVGNWQDVVAAVIPGSIEPHLMDGRGDASANGIRGVAQHLRKTDPEGLAMLLDIWEQSPGVAAHRRVAHRFDWVADDGSELRFHCVFTNLTSFEPYKAMDLFPADAATFDWLSRA